MENDTPVARSSLIPILACIAMMLFSLNFYKFLEKHFFSKYMDGPPPCRVESEGCTPSNMYILELDEQDRQQKRVIIELHRQEAPEHAEATERFRRLEAIRRQHLEHLRRHHREHEQRLQQLKERELTYQRFERRYAERLEQHLRALEEQMTETELKALENELRTRAAYQLQLPGSDQNLLNRKLQLHTDDNTIIIMQ